MDIATRDRPLPGDWSVRRGRDAYLAENGFTVEAYDDPTTEATAYGVTIHVPNTPKHRWAIMLHDLHHVVTGYGTDPAGEGEVSAWEAQRGMKPLGLYVGAIVTYGCATGLVLAPRRTLAAWRAAASTDAPSLYAEPFGPYEALLELTIGELRERLGVPRGGLNPHPRALHHGAPRPSAAL